MTRLSVIVPCFNVESYVGQTIASLRRNVGDGVEFVFVDDASTDSTATVLQQECDRLPGATIITASTNSGLASARNLGLESASGDYITYLDADDYVAAGYYADLVAVIERLGCDMVRTDHVQVSGRKRSVHRILHHPRGRVMSPREAILPVDRATSVDAPYAWAGIYHRRLADRGLLHFEAGLRTCEDRPWNWRLHLGAESFAVVGMLGIFYRRGVVNSLTQISDTRQFDFLKALDHVVRYVEDDPDADLLMPKVLRSYAAMVCHHLGRSDTYEPALAMALRDLCRSALGRLPQDSLDKVLTGMDDRRQATISDLRITA